MIDRENYCKDCDRSIYAKGLLAKSCDNNIADNGYFNLAGEKCYCKIRNGKMAEKYPWEERRFENDQRQMDKYPLHRTGETGYNGTGKCE